MSELEAKKDGFYYEDQKIQIISGAIHYFRVLPEYWKDRLLKLKACGFNTVETYIPWNVHQPEPEEFVFSGRFDVERFIELAGELGLKVIVRPSPYICAEWEFGGLPYWLLNKPGLKIRCHNQPFLEAVDRYYDQLVPRLRPLLSTQGGPVLALQIENEYGSYGNDQQYLEYLKKALRKRGIDVLLFTSDGPDRALLEGGSLPGVLKTINFGSAPDAKFDLLQKYQPDKPLMCMEFWNGWFDHWGEEHHRRSAGDTAEVLDKMLARGASVNFFMFHGGTNFGFYNGANNEQGNYQPMTTSYDYNAPLTESGQITEKYRAIKEVITRYQGADPNQQQDEQFQQLEQKEQPGKAYGIVELEESVGLFSVLDDVGTRYYRNYPVSMEELNQDYGFVLYRNKISGPLGERKLHLQGLHDRALIFLNQEFIGIVDRNDERQFLDVELDREENLLEIVVENLGRCNYGPHLQEKKGIVEGVRIDKQFLFDWTIFSLPLDNTDQLQFDTVSEKNRPLYPRFFKGKFEIQETEDTFVDFSGWEKGVILINGFNLGRYWNIGPQQTLYLPGPLLKKGENELVVFELQGQQKPKMELISEHIFVSG